MDIVRMRRIWKNMKQRCYNPNHKSYKYYGAKGVKVCEEWLPSSKPFIEWALENGYTDELTIDRIESDRDYEPGNCRWITRAENTQRATLGKKINRQKGYIAGRKSTTTLYEFRGEEKTLYEWEKVLGIARTTLNMRINKYHWSIEKAFTKPVTKRRKGG